MWNILYIYTHTLGLPSVKMSKLWRVIWRNESVYANKKGPSIPVHSMVKLQRHLHLDSKIFCLAFKKLGDTEVWGDQLPGDPPRNHSIRLTSLLSKLRGRGWSLPFLPNGQCRPLIFLLSYVLSCCNHPSKGGDNSFSHTVGLLSWLEKQSLVHLGGLVG